MREETITIIILFVFLGIVTFAMSVFAMQRDNARTELEQIQE